MSLEPKQLREIKREDVSRSLQTTLVRPVPKSLSAADMWALLTIVS